MNGLELHLLLIFMIIGAVVAVSVKDLLSSVVAVGAVGLALAFAFLVLKAPDVAITQLVVEILCLVILIRATLNRDLDFSSSGRWLLNTTIAAVFILAFLSVAFIAFRDLPEFGDPLLRVSETYLAEGLKETGATNLVTSVLLDFRAYDTLGEATVLLTAVVGVLAIARRTGRRKPGQEKEVTDE